MSTKSKLSEDSEVNITFEDQQKINTFARYNARLQDVKEELKTKKKALENLEDAENEVMMADDQTASVPFMIGEVFVHFNPDDTQQMLDQLKDELKAEIDALNTKGEKHQQVLSDLKVQLYAKFGNNINLEADEEQ